MNEQNKKENSQYPSSTSLKNACEDEYQQEKDRISKLDNKIYILLALCGVLFISITQLLDLKNTKLIPFLSNSYAIISIVYILSVCITVSLFLWAIFVLLGIMKGQSYACLPIEQLGEFRKYSSAPDVTDLWLLTVYQKIVKQNRAVNEKRIKQFNRALIKIVLSIVFYFISYVIKCNFL